MEMGTIKTDENDAVAFSSNEGGEVSIDVQANGNPDATERDQFLSEQAYNGNGGHADAQRNRGNNDIGHRESAVCKVRNQLNEEVCHGVKLWMIIVLMLLIITAVTILTLVVCAAIHQDVDEKFDPSLFKVPHYLNGSFQLPNFEKFPTPSSNESQTLTAELQKKLADLYTSSPALGRYFSKVEIQAFRNSPVTVDYTLMFHLPEEDLDQLRSFTLSREMVFNVFRQFLYDQDFNESEPMYIDPDSLQMNLIH